MRLTIFSLVSAFVVAVPEPALAYIGPGISAGTVAVIIGLICSVLLALFAVVWYPLKRLLRQMRAEPKAPDDQ